MLKLSLHKEDKKVVFYTKFKVKLARFKIVFSKSCLVFIFPSSGEGPCDPECSEVGCDGPGPDHCNDCLNYYYKLKNNTR